MNTSVEISIVIPCFNDGVYIQETIDSVNAQTFRDTEIIIVDDSSTDKETLKILAALKQDNLKVIHTEKNSGPSIARNKGIKVAQGDYILPLDADDKIAPTYLEKAKAVLDSNNNMGIVYCEADFFGEKTGKWDLPPYSFPKILVANMIFATAMYRKKDWEVVGGYNVNMCIGNEDYDFWLSLLELGREVHRIPETLFSYRIKKVSRTTNLNENDTLEIDSYEQIFNNHKKLYADNIRIFFEELKRKEKIIIEKDEHIIDKYKEVQGKDRHIEDLGEDLEYARLVIGLRDEQLNFRNKQLDFKDEKITLLTELTLKRRLKDKVKKIIPDKILTMFGYGKYEPFIFPLEDFSIEDFPTSVEAIRKNTIYQYEKLELTEDIKNEIKDFDKQPLISIVMPVYDVAPKWLDLAIKSIENQWYDNWELCIADDKSPSEETIEYLKNINNPKIKVTFLEENLNISGATNAALEIATGEYIALMDNDDEITPDALYEMVKAINENDAEFIYSDEDFISTEGECSNPHFKPDFSPDLLLSHNYITHFSCFKRELLDKVGHFNPEFDGSQDYDLFLRLTEQTSKIYHIQKVLYHWRMLETSTSANSEAKPEAIDRGRVVVQETLKRRGIDGVVEHGNMHHYFRIKYNIKGNPLVSIVIPFKDKPELLDMSINSILDKSTYQNYEIIAISNNSEEPETFEMMAQIEKKDDRVSFYEYNVEFNYSDINNHGVNTYAKGEHIVLLNNDIEVISPDWIESMLELSQRDNTGCVGAKLYYPNETVQHAGIIVGLGGYAGHSHKMYPRDNPGYFNRLSIVQNFSALTAACLMVKKSIYNEVNGMDEIKFKVAYNDVDFCLRVREKGYLNIFTPYAEMYHHESVSRGYETTPEKIARFQTEKDALSKRHSKILTNGDPYYNSNLSYDREDFSIATKHMNKKG